MKIMLVLVPGKTFRNAAGRGRPYRSYAATTLLHLAALVPPELNADIELVDLMTATLPDDPHADIMAISTWTCGAPEAYRIAAAARRQGSVVVMGGPHPTQMPREAAVFADAVVIGPGEKSWPRLLRDFHHSRLRPVYCDYTDPFRDPLPALDRKLLSRQKYYFRNCLEATRGCPNGCAFCVVSGNMRGQCWMRDVTDVAAEVESLGRQALFLDSSITEFKGYARNLWRELAPLRTTWYSTATVRFAEDTEMVRLASRSGCRGVLIGFESVNQTSLGAAGKSFNTVRRYKEMVGRLHDYGILVLGCFVFGFDDDDMSVFERTVELADSARMDLVRYAILTPLPATPLYESLRRNSRILSDDWGLYDTEHVVFRPRRMTPGQLRRGWQQAYRQTYSCTSMLRRLLRKGSPLARAVPANLLFKKMAHDFNAL